MIKVKVEIKDDPSFTIELKRLTAVNLHKVVKDTEKSIYNRGKRPGGTPVRTGELRQSLGVNGDEVGYKKEYAPQVEYGHRTPAGTYVKGRRYLQRNVEKERPLFKKRIEKAIRGK